MKPRLADFGLAILSSSTAAAQTSDRNGSLSLRWMAPELHMPQSAGLNEFERTPATDIYAFALVCMEVRTFIDSCHSYSRKSYRYIRGTHHFMRFEKILQ